MAKHNVSIGLVNKALKATGLDCEIFKGEGYYYFNGPAVEMAEEQGVYGVRFLSDMSVAQWVEEAKAKCQ
ncbi:hypothetical protein D3C81_365180 [compost metagenome]